MSNSVEVFGIDTVKAAFESMTDKDSINMLRATIHGVASDAAKEMKLRLPVNTGFLKKQIHAKRRRSPKLTPYSEVVFKRSGKRAAFYWRFIEYGQAKGQQPRPFVRPVVLAYNRNYAELFKNSFLRAQERKFKRLAKKRMKDVL